MAKAEVKFARRHLRPARPKIRRVIIYPLGQIHAVLLREGPGLYLPDNGREVTQ
tara:strand:+ start:2481 stop:2642 length:162 start_codon:yes stop_codon:yes gene_type:complete